MREVWIWATSLLLAPLAQAAPGAIVVWEMQDPRAATATVDLAAHCLELDGKPRWGTGDGARMVANSDWLERQAVSVSDGAGGCIVVFEMSDGKGDDAIAAQRLAADGKPLWNRGESSVLVANSRWRESRPQVVSDGAGGVLVLFQCESEDGDQDIRGQRLNADGELLWEEGKASTEVAYSKMLERNPRAVPDGAGGAVVVFEYEAAEGEHAGDTEIAAQRVSGDGKLLWEDGKRAVAVCSSNWIEREPVVVADGQGGATVVCEVSQLADPKADRVIVAQRLTADGELAWEGGRMSVAVADSAASERRPRAVGDGAGGVIIVYDAVQTRNGAATGEVDLGAARLSAAGKMLWGSAREPLQVVAGSTIDRSAELLSDGRGGCFVAWERAVNSGARAGDSDLYVQRLSSAGKLTWSAGKPVLVAGSANLERRPKLCSDGAGGLLLAFESEGRSGAAKGDSQVAAQRVDATGKLLWGQGQPVLIGQGAWRDQRPQPLLSGGGSGAGGLGGIRISL
ncbi:MAG: hypothetical protein IT204_01565 [Fimbriimonadaceae bacterium]|nr:hypothetical protein [Fimbriimonadaceae bacterium]